MVVKFLSQFSFHLFNNNLKSISEDDFEQFIIKYREKFLVFRNIKDKLIKANIISKSKESIHFQYVYIYYYFVGKYFSDRLKKNELKVKVSELLTDLDKKDNSNIIVFIAHHSKDFDFIDDIILESMSLFEGYNEATLSDNSKNIVKSISESINHQKIIDQSNCPNKSRDHLLQVKDHARRANINENRAADCDASDSGLLKELRKSAKCMEIVGQILKNQYGSFDKGKLRQLFNTAQGTGLRLLKSFILFMENESEELEGYIRNALQKRLEEQQRELSKSKIDNLINKIITEMSYGVIFGWLNKIVDCLGYSKTLSIANEINEETNTVASNLINISIHLWDGKKLDIKKLRNLYESFEKDKNFVAMSYLKYVVVRHIYMHKIDYQKKQAIKSLFGFSVSNQLVAQKQLLK